MTGGGTGQREGAALRQYQARLDYLSLLTMRAWYQPLGKAPRACGRPSGDRIGDGQTVQLVWVLTSAVGDVTHHQVVVRKMGGAQKQGGRRIFEQLRQKSARSVASICLVLRTCEESRVQSGL
jgi:hypothetical protein